RVTHVTDVISGNDSFDEEAKGFVGSRKDSLTFGIDAGVSIQPVDWLRIGATGRNLNEPRFKVQDSDDFVLYRQFRGGVAVRPVETIELALDADLIPNKSSALPGVKSRQIGGGVEWAPEWDGFG